MSFDAQLRCMFCPKVYPDFGPLGKHVQSDHPNEVEVIRQAINNSPRGEEKKVEMLPDPSSSSEIPPRGKRGGAGALEYLKNDHLTKNAKEARILGVRVDTENKFGARVLLKLVLEGKTLFWGVNIKKNPNYQSLVAKFGKDEDDWVDKKILLFLQEDSFTGTWFPHCEFPDGEKSRKKAG